MTSSSRRPPPLPPSPASRAATGASSSIPSSTHVAFARSAPLSNSGTTSSTGGGPLRTASAASRYTASMSAAERVKLTTYRWHAATPNLPWIHPIARIVASTSAACADSSPPASISRSARSCTALCWRTSSDAAWNPNVSACQIRFCSSPNACCPAPAPASESWTRRRSARNASQPG